MTDQWTNRIEIKSQTSSRVYTVARNIHSREWACSCPGWKAHRNCKHLKSMNLAPRVHQQTHPAPRGLGVQSDNFTDEAYKHYNVSKEGFGTPEEWFRLAEQMAHGRKRYIRHHYSSHDEDMRLLGLTEMPLDVKGLVHAMRLKAKDLHPDFGGDSESFTAMFMAYERLLKGYPS